MLTPAYSLYGSPCGNESRQSEHSPRTHLKALDHFYTSFPQRPPTMAPFPPNFRSPSPGKPYCSCYDLPFGSSIHRSKRRPPRRLSSILGKYCAGDIAKHYAWRSLMQRQRRRQRGRREATAWAFSGARRRSPPRGPPWRLSSISAAQFRFKGPIAVDCSEYNDFLKGNLLIAADSRPPNAVEPDLIILPNQGDPHYTMTNDGQTLQLSLDTTLPGECRFVSA